MFKHEFKIGLTSGDGSKVWTYEQAEKKVAVILLASGIKGCNFNREAGMWDGVREETLAVVIYDEQERTADMNNLAYNLAVAFEQQAVLIATDICNNVRFISGK